MSLFLYACGGEEERGLSLGVNGDEDEEQNSFKFLKIRPNPWPWFCLQLKIECAEGAFGSVHRGVYDGIDVAEN